MQPGRLIHRIIFQKKESGKDSFGQTVEKWSDIYVLWGTITDQFGKEYNASQAEQSVTNCNITIRNYKNVVITTDMRASHGRYIYDIKSISNNEKQTYLKLQCQKGVRHD
ncbi:phage head closure protein [Gilliamella apicola]|uniref:phage head closure protein n=1 Tax=Gilliamella apicola TaxID=1196095 RepID=UPI002FEE4A18